MKSLAHDPRPAIRNATSLLFAVTCLLMVVAAHAAPRSEMVTPLYKVCTQRDEHAKATTKLSAPVASPSTGAAHEQMASAARCTAKVSA